jgi:two-component system sensor histidine kinase BarA
VADDDPVSRIFAVSILSNSGAEITESTNGDDAIQLAHNNEYDVIFLDIYMPGTNGIEAMRKIKNGNGKSSNTPVIALTSNNLYRKKSNCAKLGFDACLVKPIDNTTLLNVALSQLDLTDIRFHDMDFSSIRMHATPPAIPENGRLYDVEKALRITGGNAELADELFNSLLDELPEMKEKLNKAFDHKDYKNMESGAHKIHGAAAYCAVTSIKDLAGKLEKATIKKKRKDIETCLKQLNSDIDRILGNSRRAAG